MRLNFISSAEKKKIIEQLNEQFGIEKLPYLLFHVGKQRVRAFSGNLSREELKIIEQTLRIDNIGIYLLTQEQEIRLSFDVVSLLKNQIKKNLIELSDSETQDWFKGHDIELNHEIKPGPVILKNKECLIGAGKSNGKTIFNFVPRERRIKN